MMHSPAHEAICIFEKGLAAGLLCKHTHIHAYTDTHLHKQDVHS
jgi:hypothetical protein